MTNQVEYHIQKATTEHFEQIVSLWVKLMNIHKDFDKDFFANTDSSIEQYRWALNWSLDNSEEEIFIAVLKNKIIGFVTCSCSDGGLANYNQETYCTIGDIMIESEYQKLGIGQLLLKEVKKWAKSKASNNIILNVFSKNTSALHFFKSQGFNDNFHNLILKIE